MLCQSTELWEAGALEVVGFESILELLTGGGMSETDPAPHLPGGTGLQLPLVVTGWTMHPLLASIPSLSHFSTP